MSLSKTAIFSMLLVASTSGAFAAQSPTGTLAGRVTDTQGRSVGAVTVSVESPALQGQQQTTTSPNGDYIFKFLPPGTYTIVFAAPGLQPMRFTRNVAAAEPVSLDVSLGPAVVREGLTVVADNSAFVNTVESAANVKQSLLGELPTARTMLSAVNLSPAVHGTGPGGNVLMNGAMSFENLYMVNGVQVQDNLRGEPLSLFIEDAILETTVTTSGVSAEYGRFSGGVVNTVTRSGGNLFGGSFRTSFQNDNWRSVSPFGESKLDSTNPTHEFTLGGPVLQDRLWFFAAGRLSNRQRAEETGYTRTSFNTEKNEKRFEIKATQALATGQRLQMAYTGISRRETNTAWPDFSSVMDLASLTHPETPESLLALHYTGTFGDRFFLEAQYSARTFAFKRSGALGRDLIADTPLRDMQTGAFWWSPNFCGVCSDEERNNDSLLLKGSYFLSTGAGSHSLVFGYDGFNDKTLADNFQSGSDYHVWTTGSIIENDVIYPVIDPGLGTYIINWPVLEASKGTNFRTHSLFFNDSWSYNRHFSFNLGARYDRNRGRDASGTLAANDHAFSPRVGVVWDPKGDGRTSLNLSMGRYVAAIANSIAGSTSAAGNPSIFAYFYDGAPINTGSGPYVTTDVALAQVFDWYFANQPGPAQVDLQGLTRRINGSLKSPHADEIAFGVTRQVGSRGTLRADFVNRTFGDFYAERVDTSTGQVSDEFDQLFDLKLIENTNDLTRRYRALNLSGDYRGIEDLSLGASYSLSRLSGNNNGENSSSGPLGSTILTYPEYRDPAWRFPEGDLSADQRHRARVWAVYSLPWVRDELNMSLGLLQTMESGTPYGALGTAVVSPFVTNPGYVTAPDLMAYYFTPRDEFRTDAMLRTDLSFNLGRKLTGVGGPEVFAQFQLLNVFNRFQLFNITDGGINTTVRTIVDDENLQLFDPFTETPQQGVHWEYGPRFGEAISKNAYTLPRTFKFSVGLRF